MKKTIFIPICVVAMLLMTGLVTGLPSEEVFVTNITFWPSYDNDPGQMPLACGEYFNFSAHISDDCTGTFGTGIHTVYFVIRAIDATDGYVVPTILDERFIPGVRVSGDADAGTWVGEYTPEPILVPQGGLLEWYLYGIEVHVAEDNTQSCTVITWGTDGAFWELPATPDHYFYCAPPPDGERTTNCLSDDSSDAIDVWYGHTGRAVNSTCDCEPDIQLGSCTIYNVYEENTTIPSGCVGTYVENSIECDYCDPLWTPVYTTCGGPSQIGFDYAFMKGTVDKIYDSPNTCCDDTRNTIGNLIFNHDGGSSDCIAPYDGGQTITCSIDAWLRGGHNYYGSNRNAVPAWGGDRKTVNFNTMRKIGNFSFGSEFQPLVFDVDYDGRNNIILLDGGKIYDYSLESDNDIYLKRSVSTAYTWTGQPAIYGIEELI